MDVKSVFSALAFAFSLAFYWPYVKAIIAGSARPTISSWISWLAMDTAILAGILAAGEMAWQMVAYCIGGVAVIVSCVFKKATLGWTRLDTVCVVLTAIAIALWSVTGNPDIDIVLSNIAITIGSVPFFVNVWRDPTREPLVPWLLIEAGGICGNIAIREWTIGAALTPLWFLAILTATVILIARKLCVKEVVA